MKIDVSIDTKQLEEAMNQRASEVESRIQKAVVEATSEVLKESRNQLSEQVYNVPEATRKNGKKAWKRTNNLIRQERAYYSKKFEGTIDNRAPYAQARHDLDRPSPIDGKTRRAPWRKTTVEVMEPKVKKILEDAVKKLAD